MSMIEIHRSALRDIIVPYNEFLRAQNSSANQIFGFVEGRDDPAYYLGHIENIINNDNWCIRLIEAGNEKGNRKKVLDLLRIIDWNYYLRKQVLFFIDRDLSLFLDIEEFNDENLYVTDMYSIENNIVTKYTLKRVLREYYNVSLQEYEWEIIDNYFECGLRAIIEVMAIITSYYIAIFRNGEMPCFDSIQMKDLFYIDKCRVIVKEIDYNEYLNSRWNTNLDNIETTTVLKEFIAKDGKSKFIRGKNLMWFFVNFINSFCKNCHEIIPSIQKPICGCRELDLNNAIRDLGSKTRPPKTLRDFLNATCILYIQNSKGNIA